MHHPALENGPAGGLEIGRRVGWKPCRDVQRAGEWVGNPGTDPGQSRQAAALISGKAATMLDATLMSGNAATMLDNTVM